MKTKHYEDGSRRMTPQRPTGRAKDPVYARPVDPKRVRPMPGTVFLRVEYQTWAKTPGGIFVPSKEKSGRAKDMGLVISKEEYKFADVLAVAKDVDWLAPGDRVVIPTNRDQDGCAIGTTAFNHVNHEVGGSYDLFLRANAVLGIVEE